MKKIFEIMSVYIGLVIGAGFASGREIFEYFNISSRHNFIGIIIATLFFAIIAYITMQQSNDAGALCFDVFIEKKAGKAAWIIKLFMTLYMFCGFFVMMSGSGALISKTFSISSFYGTILLAVICFISFSFDIKGMVAINAIMVPVMVIGISFLCISSALYGGVPAFAHFSEINHHPIVSATCYVGYNTITAGAVLVPIAAKASRKQLVKAAILSSTILGILIFSVWSTLNIYYDVIAETDLPLLEIAMIQSPAYDVIYTVVLFMALCTTAVSHGFGIMSKFKTKTIFDRMLLAAVLCLTAMPFAQIGFSTLVAKLYAAFGVMGVFWMFWIIFKYLTSSDGYKTKK